MNKVILMGRLTRDAEIRYSQGESATAIARFSLAVDRRFRRDGDDQNTDFINCVAFGRTAEFLERFGRKGTKFVLEGRIQTGSYTNKDGNILISIFFTKFASSKGCHTIWAEIIPLLLDAGNAAVRKTNVRWIKMKCTVIR